MPGVVPEFNGSAGLPGSPTVTNGIVAVLVLAVTVVVGPDAWPHVLGVPAVFDAATWIW